MKKLLLACVVTFIGFSATVGTSSAATPQNSRYCMDNINDPSCTIPEKTETMTKLMAVNKDLTKGEVIENHSRFCQDNITLNDPVCDPKVVSDTTGY
jgi:hypothetical protein